VIDQARVLVGKRRPDQVWGGLWELPRVTLLPGESDEDAVRRLGRELLGCAARLRAEAGSAPLAATRHTVMSERIELRVLEGTLRGGPRARIHTELRWVSAAELASLALPSPQRRVAAEVVSRIRRP
jgi:8-oxo-dGTP pyrophosphatase MutT (NUDIX family)